MVISLINIYIKNILWYNIIFLWSSPWIITHQPLEDDEQSLEVALEGVIAEELGPNVVIKLDDNDLPKSEPKTTKILSSEDEPSKDRAVIHDDSQLKELLESVIQQLTCHEKLSEFCDFSSIDKVYFKTTSSDVDTMKLDVSKWLAFLRWFQLPLSDATEKYMNMILSQVPENPLNHNKFESFAFDFKTKNNRVPFTSVRNAKDDFEQFQEWLAIDAVNNKVLKVDVTKAVTHCLFPNYVIHCVNQGGDESDFNSIEAVMNADGEAILSDWNDFIATVDWVHQDLGKQPLLFIIYYLSTVLFYDYDSYIILYNI